jgi:hypothetical protein
MSSVYRRMPLQGYRLRATDTEWAKGEGTEVAGTIAALVLVLTGRRVALDQLTGEGAEALRAALT